MQKKKKRKFEAYKERAIETVDPQQALLPISGASRVRSNDRRGRLIFTSARQGFAQLSRARPVLHSLVIYL